MEGLSILTHDMRRKIARNVHKSGELNDVTMCDLSKIYPIQTRVRTAFCSAFW